MSGKLRITAGAFKNRALKVPEGEAVRPTSERARQAMFNRLEHSFQDYGFRLRRARVADLFAGTGALGLEALSRGAAHVTFVEIARATHLKDNISALGVEDKTTVLTLDAAALPAAAQPYGLILMDAPYGVTASPCGESLTQRAVDAVAAKGWLAEHGLIVAETGKDETLSAPDGLEIEDVRGYGRGALTYLMRVRPALIRS
jgi:16S rRNA (guanine966-N2)-methyltransferase